MPVSIYTNRASHTPTYLPTEQAIPFSAYAAVGAQQQERTDKYRDAMAELMPDLTGIEEDTDAVREFTDKFHKTQQEAMSRISDSQDVPGAVEAIGRLKRMSAMEQGSKEWAVKQRSTERKTDFANIDTIAGKDSPEIAGYLKRKAKVFTPELGYTPEGGYNPVGSTEVVKPLSDKEELANTVSLLSTQGDMPIDPLTISNITSQVEGGADGATILRTSSSSGVERKRIADAMSAAMKNPNSDVFKSRRQEAELELYNEYMGSGQMSEEEAIRLAEQNSGAKATESIDNYIAGISALAESEDIKNTEKVITPNTTKKGGGKGEEVLEAEVLNEEGTTRFATYATSAADAEGKIETLKQEIETANNEGQSAVAAQKQEVLNLLENRYTAASQDFRKKNAGADDFLRTTLDTEVSTDGGAIIDLTFDPNIIGGMSNEAALLIEEHNSKDKNYNSLKQLRENMEGLLSKAENFPGSEGDITQIGLYINKVLDPLVDKEDDYEEAFDKHVADGGGITTELYTLDESSTSTEIPRWMDGTKGMIEKHVFAGGYDIQMVSNPGGKYSIMPDSEAQNFYDVSGTVGTFDTEERLAYLSRLDRESLTFVGLEGATEWSNSSIVFEAAEKGKDGQTLRYRATPKSMDKEKKDMFTRIADNMGITGRALKFDRKFENIHPGTNVNSAKNLGELDPLLEGVKYYSNKGTGHRVSNIDASSQISSQARESSINKEGNVNTKAFDNNIRVLTSEYLAKELNLSGQEARALTSMFLSEQSQDPTNSVAQEWVVNNKTFSEADMDKALGNPYIFKSKRTAFLKAFEKVDPTQSKKKTVAAPEGYSNLSDTGIKMDTKQVSNPTISSTISNSVAQLNEKFPGLLVTGATRDKATNSSLENSVENSKHLEGKALDLRTNKASLALANMSKQEKTDYGIKSAFQHGNHVHVEWI